MGRFPGQFLRRTELIKRSLRLGDEPKWWCREPPQQPSSDDPIQTARWLVSVGSILNLIAHGLKEGPENGLSIQRATRCASRFPKWKMGPTL